jgi:putative heme-binding domain-containing protein
MRTPLLIAALWLTGAAPLAAQAADSAAGGELLFESQCSRCHGVGGTGGVGPALNRPKLRRAPTDADLVRVILGGVPGTAMIGFWNLSEDEAKEVAAYIRALGRRPPEVIPGDVANGRRIYEERERCGQCHILAGQGAGWAPDLTDVGVRLSAARIRESLLDPGAAQPISPLPSVHGPYPAFLAVEATTRAGRAYRGTRITEDDFTIVLRQGDGRIVSLEKTALASFKKFSGRSPMASYANTLSDSELDDIVAFLASQRGGE